MAEESPAPEYPNIDQAGLDRYVAAVKGVSGIVPFVGGRVTQPHTHDARPPVQKGGRLEGMRRWLW